MQMKKALSAAILGGMLAASSAQASHVGYILTLSGNVNFPTFSLVNTSTSAAQITDFTFTIGDTNYNFDEVTAINSTGGVGNTLVIGSTNQGGARTDVIDFDFTSFDGGDSFQFDADVDIDDNNTSEDYRSIFFNNGVAANSFIAVGFSTGQILSRIIPDDTNGLDNIYVFPQEASHSTPVPEPSTWLLLGTGLVGLVGYQRRRMAA